MLLANLPRNETFDWAEKASSELTVIILAIFFDFPFEERTKLVHYSDAFICDYVAPNAFARKGEERLALLQKMVASFRELWD